MAYSIHDVFIGTKEHEAVLLQVKQTLTKICKLKKPNTYNLFFILIRASAIGIRSVNVQADDKGQMQIISFISRLSIESEQKVAVIYREVMH